MSPFITRAAVWFCQLLHTDPTLTPFARNPAFATRLRDLTGVIYDGLDPAAKQAGFTERRPRQGQARDPGERGLRFVEMPGLGIAPPDCGSEKTGEGCALEVASKNTSCIDGMNSYLLP